MTESQCQINRFNPFLGFMMMAASFTWEETRADEALDEEMVLEEVIVTATLREVSLQDLPMSVGVVTGKELREIGAVSIDDVWRQVPNLAVRDAPFGGRTFIIRGLTDTDSFLSTESINAFYVDDTAITYISGLFNTPGDVAMLDFQRVEVLRGPQGTLVGANAMGGAIRMISNEPDPAARDIYTEVNLSNTDEGGWNYGGNAMWNQPTGPNSALRFAALYQDNDGFIDDIGLERKDINDQQRTAGRISWLWNISHQWALLARVYAEEIDTGGYNYADDVGRPWADIPTTGDYQVVLYSPEGRNEDLDIASLRLHWQGDWGEFYSSTSVYKKDLKQLLDWSVEQWYFFGLENETFSENNSRQEDFSQEFHLNSSGEARFNWLAGAYYLDQDYELSEYLITEEIPVEFLGFPAGATVVYFDALTVTKREDKAVFGEISWRFTDALEGVFGLRWYQSERRQSVSGGGMFIIPGQADKKSDGVVPKVSLSWDATDQTMIYGLFSKGYRPGQFNNAGAINVCGSRPAIDDDELDNYEIGMKHRSADGDVVVNASLFRINWDEMQFNAFGDCPFPVLENVGSASSQGFELDFNWLVTDTLGLQGGVGYNDAQLDSEFVNDNAAIKSGTPMPNVPNWSVSLAATWDFSWRPQLPGYLRVDTQYIDERTTLFDETIDFPTYRQIDAYTLVNLRLGLQTGNWLTELFITNLTNERAELFCCRNFYDPAVNRPRTIGLRTSWRTD